jgi:hypothetical protein
MEAGVIVDPDAEAISEAIQARKGLLAEKDPNQVEGSPGLLEARRVHGRRCSASADRAPSIATPKCGSCTGAAAWPARTEKGEAYGVITAKAVAVLEALLWGFHNAKSGLCFPSYERIAEAAGCARSKANAHFRRRGFRAASPNRRNSELRLILESGQVRRVAI